MAKGSRPAMKNASTIVVEAYCPLCERSFPEALELCPDDGARLVRLTQQEVDLVGTTFDGRFEILGLLGDGGMGAVYKAREIAKGREVAVKVIRTELTNDIDVAKRFLREAKVSSRLAHPNTVTVYDYGQTKDGVLFLSMELLDGRTLEEVLSSEGRVAPARAGLIGTQIFEALDAAHKQGVVHRDLKPSNIMLVKDAKGREVVKVLDFGLAKSLGSDFNTTAGFLMGTPAYLAPEIILRGEVNFASDLYAVGVLLFEILSGHVPFEDEEIPAVLMAHAHRPPPALPADIPEPVAELVFQLLSKKPSDRFASAVAAKRALLASLEDLTSVDKRCVAEMRTEEMVKLSVNDLEPESEPEDDEEPGTLRREPLAEKMDLAKTLEREAPRGDLAAKLDLAKTLEREALKTGEFTAQREPQGKGPRRRVPFVGSRTKLLTPVPPLKAMQSEIMAAVANDESVTQQMAAILAEAPDDTDEILDPSPEESDPDDADTMLTLGKRGDDTTEMPVPAHEPGRARGHDEAETNKIEALSKPTGSAGTDEVWDGPIDMSTAVVDRDIKHKIRGAAEPEASAMHWSLWVLIGLSGLAAGFGAWWLLGQ